MSACESSDYVFGVCRECGRGILRHAEPPRRHEWWHIDGSRVHGHRPHPTEDEPCAEFGRHPRGGHAEAARRGDSQ